MTTEQGPSFGEVLKKCREEAHLTKAGLGRALAVSIQTINRVERSGRPPRYCPLFFERLSEVREFTEADLRLLVGSAVRELWLKSKANAPKKSAL